MSLTSSRRDFLRTAFAASVVGATCGSALIANVIPELREENGSILGIYTLDFSTDPKLAPLKNVTGSVIIRINAASGSAKQMVLTRVSDTEFIAVSAFCTHSGCVVEPYNSQSQRIDCLCHGSRFTVDGKVIQGPAFSPLPQYTATFAGGESVGIEVPGLVGVEDELPNRFSLESSPNPATDHTVIKFTLPKEISVTVKIMNTQGEEITTLLQEILPAGPHTLPFKTESLAAGVYFYQLTAGRYSETKQLTIIR